MEIERRAGLIPSAEFWTVNEEWVEPMEQWIAGEHTIASLASTFDIHEGNIQKALMKLASLLEEFQAMATLLKNVELLKVLEGGRALIVRDLILAESLYLRI
jgi:superfamily II RNA helicase